MSYRYINAALELARYEAIAEDDRVYGEIAELPGVWASGKTHEECRRNLSVTIESWILVSKTAGITIPPIEGVIWAEEGTGFDRAEALLTVNSRRHLTPGLSRIRQWISLIAMIIGK